MKSWVILFLIVVTAACVEPDKQETEVQEMTEDQETPQYWEYQTCGSVSLEPIIDEGKVYVSSHDGVVYCLDQATGELLWRTETDVPVQRIMVDDSLLLIGTDTIHAVDNKSGSGLWELCSLKDIKTVVLQNDLYVVTKDKLFCIAKEGTLLWEASLPLHVFAERMLVLHEDFLLVEEATNLIGCYSTEGRPLWQIHIQEEHGHPLLFAEDKTAFIVSGALYAVQISSGKQKWILKRDSPLVNPVLTDSNIVVKSGEALICVDRNTGHTTWEIPFSSKCPGYAVVGKRLYFPADKKGVSSVIREQDGVLLVSIDKQVLAVAGTRENIIFSTTEGVFCYNNSTGKVLWEYSNYYYMCRQVTLCDDAACMVSDSGMVYYFPLSIEAPFPRLTGENVYTQSLGRVKSIRIKWFLDYTLRTIFGEVYIVWEDGRYVVVESYEDGTTYMTGEKCFTGKIIPEELVDKFYSSMDDLYINSQHEEDHLIAGTHIYVEVELERGQKIYLEPGYDMDSFVPWTVTCGGVTVLQYSGRLSVAFKEIMREVGWGYREEFRTLHMWGVVRSGFCENPVGLLELLL
ncbi:MAG: PQQ-binding-like beta-propeller repeat protein [Candidatus Methanofastidiosia archaeon]